MCDSYSLEKYTAGAVMLCDVVLKYIVQSYHTLFAQS